jgi:hypothetical protein
MASQSCKLNQGASKKKSIAANQLREIKNVAVHVHVWWSNNISRLYNYT